MAFATLQEHRKAKGKGNITVAKTNAICAGIESHRYNPSNLAYLLD
jgi:hypothetical protein